MMIIGVIYAENTIKKAPSPTRAANIKIVDVLSQNG
jgi:hypothetical protein